MLLALTSLNNKRNLQLVVTLNYVTGCKGWERLLFMEIPSRPWSKLTWLATYSYYWVHFWDQYSLFASAWNTKKLVTLMANNYNITLAKFDPSYGHSFFKYLMIICWFFFVVLLITCFRLNARCTYSCIGTSGKKLSKTSMRGFWQKTLQRVFEWVVFSVNL